MHRSHISACRTVPGRRQTRRFPARGAVFVFIPAYCADSSRTVRSLVIYYSTGQKEREGILFSSPAAAHVPAAGRTYYVKHKLLVKKDVYRLMKAIILAGGQGSRLRPVSGGLPKPMMPLCGRPLLEHIINLLARQGFRELCLTLGYRPDVIREHFGSGKDFGVSITYQVEETPLGTAGGVRQCAHFYGNEDFLVISGDAACDFDLSRLMAHHREHRCAATLALTRCRAPLRFGLVPTDETGRVLAFLEKPTWERVVTDQVNTGIYALSPRAMAPGARGGGPLTSARSCFPCFWSRTSPSTAWPMEGYWCDIGTPEEYFRCNLDALAGGCAFPSPWARLRPQDGGSGAPAARRHARRRPAHPHLPGTGRGHGACHPLSGGIRPGAHGGPAPFHPGGHRAHRPGFRDGGPGSGGAEPRRRGALGRTHPGPAPPGGPGYRF